MSFVACPLLAPQDQKQNKYTHTIGNSFINISLTVSSPVIQPRRQGRIIEITNVAHGPNKIPASCGNEPRHVLRGTSEVVPVARKNAHNFGHVDPTS